MKIKLLLLSLITPLLCGVSFGFNPFSTLNNTQYFVKSTTTTLSNNIVMGHEYCVYYNDSSNTTPSIYFQASVLASWGCFDTNINYNNSNE